MTIILVKPGEKGASFVTFAGTSDSESKILEFPGDIISCKNIRKYTGFITDSFVPGMKGYISSYAKAEGMKDQGLYLPGGYFALIGDPYPEFLKPASLPEKGLTCLVDVPGFFLDEDIMSDIPGFENKVWRISKNITQSVANFLIESRHNPDLPFKLTDIYSKFSSPMEDNLRYVKSALDDLEAQGLVVKTGNTYKLNPLFFPKVKDIKVL